MFRLFAEREWAQMQNTASWNADQNKMAAIQTLSLRDQFQFAVICGFEIPQH